MKDKPTLYLVHGMWGSASSWDRYRGHFQAAGYRCIVPTLIHHDADPAAEPPNEVGPLSIGDYTEFLEKELRALDEKPVIFGWSMGGLIAQFLAAKGLARAIVLVAPIPPRGIPTINWVNIKMFLGPLLSGAFWKKPQRPSFRQACNAFLHNLPPQRQKDEYARLVYDSGRVMTEIGLGFKTIAIEDDAIQCPILIVGGSLDRIVRPKCLERLKQKYGDRPELKIFDDKSHWITGEEGWEQVAEYCLKWIETKVS